MEKLEITSLSSRGQVVIPQTVREQLHLKIGEKFVVIGENGTILLKKIEIPSFGDFNGLLRKTQKFAKERKIKPKDVKGAISRVRG